MPNGDPVAIILRTAGSPGWPSHSTTACESSAPVRGPFARTPPMTRPDVVDRRPEHRSVVPVPDRRDVERARNPVVSITAFSALEILEPQLRLHDRLRHHHRAFGVRVPPAVALGELVIGLSGRSKRCNLHEFPIVGQTGVTKRKWPGRRHPYSASASIRQDQYVA